MAPVLLLSPKLYKISSSRENPSSAPIEQKKPSQQQKQQLLLISTISTTTKHLGNNKLLATTTTTTTANYSLPHSTVTSRSSSRSSSPSPFAQFAIPPTFNSTINNPTPIIINNNNDNDNNNNDDNNDDNNNNDNNNRSNNNNNRMFKRSAVIIKLNNNNHEDIKPININSSKTNNNVANNTNNNVITNNNNNSTNNNNNSTTIDNNYNFLLEPKPIIIKSKQQLEQQQQQRQEQYLQLSSPSLRTSFGWPKHNSIAPTKSTSTASIISATTSKLTASKSSLKSKASSSSSSLSTTSSNSTSSSHVSTFTSKSSASSASNNVKNNRNAITLNQGKKSIQDILNKSHRTEREVKFTLSKLRRLILDEGIPEENLPKLSPSIQNLIRPDSLRSTIWKRLLGVYHVSASDYVRFIKKGKSCVYEKIRSDTFRTMATDQKFLERVNEEMLIRLLNATAWKMKDFLVSGNQSISYVQGMNVLAAPFLYTMSELDAYYSFVTFIQTCCPLYVTPNLQGVHCGIKLLEKCLKILDVKLFNYLKSKNLTAIIYALPSVLTFCACTPSLDELLKLWDFLFAYGVHLNILCIIAQLVLIRDQLLEAPSPMKLLRTMPKLDAKSIINLTVEFVQKIPDDLYDLLVRHPFDSTVESLVID